MSERNLALRWGISASVLLGLTLLAGRLTGLIRELALASVFGVTARADIAVLLLTFPDLLVNLLMAGGLSAALVPRFTALPALQALALLRQISYVVFLFFGAAGMIFVIWPQSVFSLLAPGVHWPIEAGSLTLIAVAIAVPLAGLSGICGAYLNANRQFFLTGSGTLIFNTCILAFLYLSTNSSELLTYLAAGIAAGAALRLLSQLSQLPTQIWKAHSESLLIDKTLVQAFTSAAIATALMLLASIVVRAMASTLGSGAVASFNYAQKLIELPVGILITSISTVALTQLSALQANKKSIEANKCMTENAQFALLIALAVTVPGMWFADSVVHVVFSRGEMDSFALIRVADITRIAFVSLPFIAISSLAIASLNAAAETKVVLKITSIGSLLVLPLLSLPGLMLSSEQGLMSAVVGFQAFVAIWLAHKAKLRLFGTKGILNQATWRYFATTLFVGIVISVLDNNIDRINHWFRIFIAGLGFVGCLFVIRHFRQSNSQLTGK